MPIASRLVPILLGSLFAASSAFADDPRFDDDVQPILERYCYGCHGLGVSKGNVTLDELDDDTAADPANRHLWLGVLKNVRSELMPPKGKKQPSEAERQILDAWIRRSAFAIDPADPDPGRVTVRRLNRVEYKNTIRDLMGVDFDTNNEFPPDDSGHGFDNIGDVLTLSPLLLEKYLAAASAIIDKAVPRVGRVVPETTISNFRRDGAEERGPGSGRGRGGQTVLSYYEPAKVEAGGKVDHPGRYAISLEFNAQERYVEDQFDQNKARLLFFVDGDEVARRDFTRQDGKTIRFEVEQERQAGPIALAIEVQPLTPDEKQVRSLSFRLQGVKLQGPLDDQAHWVRPPNHAKFFPGTIPDDLPARRAYTRDLLGSFAAKAFRRPVDDATKDRLADLAAAGWEDGMTPEAGIARGMIAVLASPRFLFREEGAEPAKGSRFPLVDEAALASRLSYFLWSTMPDAELTKLASEHTLRANQDAQIARMLKDPRSGEFFRHFVGQWLQARDIETVLVNAQAVVARDQQPDPDAERRRARFRELVTRPADTLTDDEKEELQKLRGSFNRGNRQGADVELTGDLRRAMRRETEMLVEHVLREDRPLTEILDCDYTFLNEKLAKHYKIDGITGDEMRKVPLPEGSPRGGVLTQGTVLAVTSNPDRTSPVKRGLFLLDNILGTPPAPPPPDIPSLEEAGKAAGKNPTVREAMALHRSDAMCASCHARMDPLGLALENFNALGLFREAERAGPIDASGTLITGEPFRNASDLKKILVDTRRMDFYRCLTEKALIYALGRGLEGPDVQAVDAIVARIVANDGRASGLLLGIIESAPFQKRRPLSTELPPTRTGAEDDD